MIPFYITMAFYIIAIGGFAALSWLNIQKDKQIESWNQSTEHEIKVIRERNLELELKVKAIEEMLKDAEK